MNREITSKPTTPAQVITVNSFTFYLYMLYIISFFLHLSARIPAISILRPDLLIAAGLIISLFLQSNNLKGRFETPCNKYLIIFLAYVILSLPFVEWPGSVLRDNLANFIKAFLFFYFTILIVDTDSRLKRLVFVFMACQLFRILEPLYMHEVSGYWGSSTHLGGGEFVGRLGGAPSDVINPNGLAFVIATLFPFLHFLWGNSRWFAKISYLAAIPPLLYALVLTMSRSGLVAILVIAWTIFVKSRHKFVLIIVGCMIATVVWTNLNDVQKDRYISMTGSEDAQSAATFQGRIAGVQGELRLALKKPIVGYGLGTSQEAIVNISGGRHVSHNLYTETFIETGIIGLVIYILFLKSVYNTLKQSSARLAEYGEWEKNKNVSSTANDPPLIYAMNLLNALIAIFWMYIIFSIAQYGLAEYHWYFLAGVATVLNRTILKKTSIADSNLP
jgi:putative inorganic carbon (HCO3(-)) transporter